MKTRPTKRTSLPGYLLIAGLMLSACAQGQPGKTQPEEPPQPTSIEAGGVSAEGWLMPVRSTTLGFMATDKLGEILVAEGQAVHQGDALARLGGLEALEAALTQARLEQISAQQALDELNDSADLLRTQSAQSLAAAEKALLDAQRALYDLDTDEYQDELDERNDAVEDAKDELDGAQEELDQHQDLDPDDTVRMDAQEEYDDAVRAYEDALNDRDSWKNRLDQAKTAVELAQARLDDAQQVYDTLQDGPDPQDLALAQARLENGLAQVAAAQSALDNATLTAPYDAVVVEVNDLESGEIVSPGMRVVILADYSQWFVETRDLTEWDVAKVQVGQKVMVTLDALPDLELAGVVESVDRLFTESRGEIVYTVHIRLEQVDPRLRWGMTALVAFE